MPRPRRLCVLAERSGGHADPFDITERVEMGQMASMFFNKGNFLPLPRGSSPHLSFIQLMADTTFISRRLWRGGEGCVGYGASAQLAQSQRQS